MNRQNQITSPTPLLDDKGNLTNPGYCKHNLFVYNRECITAPRWRIKEWDFYQIGDGQFMLQICFANISIGTAASVKLMDLTTGKTHSCLGLSLFTCNKFQMPRNGDIPHGYSYKVGGVTLSIDALPDMRIIRFRGKSKGKPFDGEVFLAHRGDHESLTIATPFKMPGRFFYTQKLNCMAARGFVTVDGQMMEFTPDRSFGVMDWGRGVWPHKNMWYWANGSTYLNDRLFGFELTWGFGDESAATETAVFYDGKCHKIGMVRIKNDPKQNGWMEPWEFISEDGRFDLTMTPYFDNATGFKIPGIVGARCHQVHGKWNGTVTLDDGTVLQIKDMYAFCERMENLW